MRYLTKHSLLLVVILLAVFLRFQNLNWDANMHLHPDERFLTMVGNAMKLPTNLGEYLNSAVSTWNPANIGFSFFVYGLFPLTINKILSLFLNTDTYNSFTIQGRFLSAIADMLVIFFIYKIGRVLKRKYSLFNYFPLYSSFLYAISIYPIQASHFFTTDTFLNTFLIISFYASLIFYFENKISYLIISSIFLGFAFSSKISAIFMFPLIGLLFFIPLFLKKNMLYLMQNLCIFILVFYIVTRLSSPYYFETGDIFNISFNKLFLNNITDLQNMASGKVLFPPAVQWYSKTPLLFNLFNLTFIGLGIFPSMLCIIGIINVLRSCLQEIKKRKSKYISDCFVGLCIIIWIVGYFIYNSLQFTQSIRYLIFLFPFFALLGGYTLSLVNLKTRILHVIVVILLLIWPVIFCSIYLFINTRIQASLWIYQYIPNNSTILAEYWDDPLPYPVSSKKQFHIEQIPVFDPDTDIKWKKMNIQLRNADYYVLSSNRGWGSIPTVPKKYPKMSKFYQDLFNGKTNYQLIKRFVPLYQSFFPFHPNSWINNWLEEAFTVYDHPSVFIYKKNKYD